MDGLTTLAHTLLPLLAWASIQAALLAGLLWMIGRFVPRLPATTRCLLWWLLGAQLLLGMAWQAPIQLPWLSAPPSQEATTLLLSTTPETNVQAIRTAAPQPANNLATTNTPMPWRETLIVLWLSGLLVQLIGLAMQWQRARRIRRDSRPLNDPPLQAHGAQLANQLGLRHCPPLRQSDAIDSPQISGLLHPMILLPARTRLAPTDQAMALAHELAHLKRGDLWLGWIPALARWLFFFHPLVHLAVREYGLAREAACDSQALRLRQATPQSYGQLLLKLGIDRSLHAGLAGASPSFRNLKRRLIMLQQTSHTLPRWRDWLLVAIIAVACIAPYRVVVAQQATQTDIPVPPAPSSVPSVPPPPSVPVPTAPPSVPAPPVPQGAPPSIPAPPILPGPPPPPPLPPPPPDFGFNAHNRHIEIDTNARFGLALYDHGKLTIRGTQDDIRAIHKLDTKHTPILWFRHDGSTWLTHDQATIKAAEKSLAPLNQLAQKQGELTGKLGAIYGKNAGLNSRKAAMAQRQFALARRKAALAHERAGLVQQQASLEQQRRALKQRLTQASAEQKDAEQQTMRALQRKLATRKQSLAARQQALQHQQTRIKQQRAEQQMELDAQRKALKKQRTQIHEQYQAMAKRQKQLTSHVAQSMQELMDKAAAKGVAKRAE